MSEIRVIGDKAWTAELVLANALERAREGKLKQVILIFNLLNEGAAALAAERGQ